MKPRTPFSRLQYSFGAGVLAIVFSCLQLLTAQTFPAIVSFTMSPPNSPYLSDFLQPGQERVMLNVNFLDQNEPSWNVKLRMNIDGNGITLRTSQPFYQSVTLSPGPNLIDLVELEQLFDFSKMDVQGINKSALVNAGRLPEGTYTFCVEVMDAARGDQLGTAGCHTATLIQNNPPQVTTPSCGDVISAAGGQNILFNWIPMHDPSIQVRYEMKLVQVPEGMNVNDAINGTSFPILDWLEINSTSFIYGPTLLPLDLNQKYAFQLRVVDVNGLTTFENDGKAPVCWFTYGYSNDGTIDLTAPAHQARVTDPARVDFAWSGPSNATNGQQLKYHIKVVKLGAGERVTNQGTGAAYMDRTQGVWYEDSTAIMPNIYGGSLTVEQPLEADAYYAWQIKSSTDGFKTAKSEVREFRAPPVIYSFWVADGGYMVEVTNTTNYTKVNENKYTNLTGAGTIVIAQGEQPTEVSFAGLTVEMIANKWVLTANEITVQKTETKELDFGDYGDGGFEVNTWVFTPMKFLAQGQVQWHFPLSVNAPGNALVVSDENVRLNYMNRELSGAVTFAQNQSYNLLIPMGFSVNYLPPSQFIISTNGATTLKMYGNVVFPSALKTVSGDAYVVPFENQSNPWYMEIPRLAILDQFVLFSNTKMTLQPKTFVIDFSGSQSPAGRFENQPEWVGAFIQEYNLFIPADFDERGQLILDEQQTLTYLFGQPDFQSCWVSAGGLNLDYVHQFEQANSQPFYAHVNTFRGKFARLRLKIEDNSLDACNFKGFIKVPFLSATRKLDWTAPITANGIQNGYFNEDSIQSFGKTYNASDPASKLILGINQAIFEGGDHIKMNVDLEWPKLEVELNNLPKLKVWGNGEFGFNEPNGSRNLTTQVPVKLGNMTGTSSKVSATFEDQAYAFTLFTNISFPGGLSSPIAPIKVAVASQNGGAAPSMTYARADGQQASGKFRIGPVKLTMDNSLIQAELFADYIENDPTFGTRFEARGNVLVKQPHKMISAAKLVIGKKNGIDFWYARCGRTGLNKILEEYPAVSMNGFDFQIFHNLESPPGMAFTQANQFSSFWDLNADKNGATTIDGLALKNNVMLGMYGKVGLHDTPSGLMQPSDPIVITEVLSDIGDILPNIPGLCDLQYQGKSVCSYLKWPWAGINLCDIQVTYMDNGMVKAGSWCDVDLFKVDWPNLQFCDLKMSNDKKFGDYTLGQLGFSDIDICALKLPNGSGLCEYFDISGNFCDLKDENGPLCNKKLCDLMPALPPVCEWKIPGMKQICQFNFGDILPNVDLCAVVNPATGKSAFCDFKWPDIFPSIPNPCDFRLPNGTKLCNLTANWCDIIVPVVRNGATQLVPLCEVKWWEMNWPTVNVCDWKINGQSLCNINLNFCDLRFPLSEQHPCDFIPNLCDLKEPVSGKKLCELSLFPLDLPNFNFCDLTWPGTTRKMCDFSFKMCDFQNPGNTQAPALCHLNWRKLIPNIPNICDLDVKMPNGSIKKLCSIGLNLNIPSICELKPPNDVSVCKIKLPNYQIPTIPIPNVPSIAGLPEGMYMWLFMSGLRMEMSNSGALNQIILEGNTWFFTSLPDPNASFLARGFGDIEMFPQQKMIDFHLTGEAGEVQTKLGKIKPLCANGKIEGFLKESDWAIDLGTSSAPLSIKLACVNALESDGYLKLRPDGLKARGEIHKGGTTTTSFDLGVGVASIHTSADLDFGMTVKVAFDKVAIAGSIDAKADASVSASWNSSSTTFASVSVKGDLDFAIDDDFCMSGKLTGKVSILDIDVPVKLGVKIQNSSINFPANPSSCD